MAAIPRVYHGELDGFNANKVIVMIGTNNLSDDSNEEIIAGLKNLVKQIIIRQPKASVVMSGILPRREMENRVRVLNESIARLSASLKVSYINPGTVLLNRAGNINESLFDDGLHPNAGGYEKLGAHLAKILRSNSQINTASKKQSK